MTDVKKCLKLLSQRGKISVLWKKMFSRTSEKYMKKKIENTHTIIGIL